jgi:RNA polymerase sigma-70 factor, ECF subfamily
MSATMPAQASADDEFEKLYAAEHASLLALAHGLSGSWTIAEEAVQEAFLRCHERWNDVSKYERPGAWLRRVTINLATSRLRRLSAEARALARLAARKSDLVPLSADSFEFWAAVRRLPRRQAQVIALYYVEDRSVPDIAEILSCAEGTVRAHLHRGREALRSRLSIEPKEET